MLVSYAFVIVALALRLAAPSLAAFSLRLLRTSALAWISGSGLNRWHFAPWLIRSRADAARPNVAVRLA